MKKLLAVISLLIAGVVCEPPAPYPPSGWRPSGPTFDLPQRGQAGQIQPPRNQEYLPPLDPRNPATNPNVEYGTPDVDVSVQGLPAQEQQPIFQTSPVNGQQYSGPSFNTDIRNLDQSYKQSQFQLQQERYREFERQRQLEATQANANANRLPQVPRQFVSRPTASSTETPSTTLRPEERTTESTTEQSLNQGETLDDEAIAQQKQKTSVEVSRQNLQEYPGELFLSSLAQLQLQPQFVPLQQVRGPLYYQAVQGTSQKQVTGFDGPTHFAALPSVLAQQQALNQPQRVVQQQAFQNPALFAEQPNPTAFVHQPLAQYQPLNAYQPAQIIQSIQPQFQAESPQPQQFQPNQFVQANYEPVQQPFAQYQPVNSYQPAVQPAVTQLQATPVIYQPQGVNQLQLGQFPQSNQPGQFAQPNQEADDNREQEQQAEQIPQSYQPQFYQQPIVVPQPTQEQIYQAQLQQFYQNQMLQQPANQGQNSLQSGLDVNQQGNDIDQTEDQDDDAEQDNGTATAVATAFGARIQPRVFSQYGAPLPAPRVQANPRLGTTTESAVEEVTEEGPAVAQAVAVASRGSAKSAKLRSRRVRPVFTVDRSGHLVLAQQQ